MQRKSLRGRVGEIASAACKGFPVGVSIQDMILVEVQAEFDRFAALGREDEDRAAFRGGHLCADAISQRFPGHEVGVACRAFVG